MVIARTELDVPTLLLMPGTGPRRQADSATGSAHCPAVPLQLSPASSPGRIAAPQRWCDISRCAGRRSSKAPRWAVRCSGCDGLGCAGHTNFWMHLVSTRRVIRQPSAVRMNSSSYQSPQNMI